MGHVVVTNAGRAMTEVKLSEKVIRCGCTPVEKAATYWHGRLGTPCPKPRAVEDLGVMAYYHRSPLRRLAFRIGRAWRWIRLGGSHVQVN